MKQIDILKGLDIPISGKPEQVVTTGRTIRHVALIGDDYPGMKPTMMVKTGDMVQCGQPLFEDKKNSGVIFTSPGSGEVAAINRGPKRKFESLIIELNNDDPLSFCPPDSTADTFSPEEIRKLLIDSGLWCSFRTRPYGKIPAVDAIPVSLFVTAIDTAPLAPDIDSIIEMNREDFLAGLEMLKKCIPSPLFLCLSPDQKAIDHEIDGVETVCVSGPHPAGLPSTHIHFLSPVSESRHAWHIGAQDVIGIGALLRTGTLRTERIITIGGPAAASPRHVRTRIGASIRELCASELVGDSVRVLSGSVLDGRKSSDMIAYLGRYHQQVSCLPEGTGRQFFGWLQPGGNRFSITRAFLSAFTKPKSLPLDTAIWGGHRAIFPLGTYEKVMPLDIIPTYLLKSLASGNTEKAKELGCLELIEEDLALCTYVCPGKNDFGAMLRDTLDSIERDG